jgi:signal transduction histidine kinase
MRPQAAQAGIELQSQIPELLPALHGDGKRLQKALLHLVSNAIKFTEKGGWVKITAQSNHGGVSIDVCDNGMGMPPAATALMETPFSQFDSSLARMHEGVGLGLTYVRRVADSHDATLRIFSELGKGTRVVMDFPATRIVKAVEVA